MKKRGQEEADFSWTAKSTPKWNSHEFYFEYNFFYFLTKEMDEWRMDHLLEKVAMKPQRTLINKLEGTAFLILLGVWIDFKKGLFGSIWLETRHYSSTNFLQTH